MYREWKKKKVFYMNLEATRLRGRPRNWWQDEVREDGGLVGGKGWKKRVEERVYNREEWKKLLRTARNSRILHMPMEWMNKHLVSLLFSMKSHSSSFTLKQSCYHYHFSSNYLRHNWGIIMNEDCFPFCYDYALLPEHGISKSLDMPGHNRCDT